MTQKRRLAGTLSRPNRLVEIWLGAAGFDEATLAHTGRGINGDRNSRLAHNSSRPRAAVASTSGRRKL